MHALIVFPVASLAQNVCCIQVGLHGFVPCSCAVDAVNLHSYAVVLYAMQHDLCYICAEEQLCCILSPDLQTVALAHA